MTQLTTAPDTLLAEIRGLIEDARRHVAQTANSTLTLLHWRLGDRISREVLQGQRVSYGEEILPTLSAKLVPEYGKGFSARNLARTIRFAETFPDQQIVVALSQELGWSHFVEILPLKQPLEREFYAEMCRVERWSVRTLRERIGSQLYLRSSLAKKPEKVIQSEIGRLRDGQMTPDTVFRDPYLPNPRLVIDKFHVVKMASEALDEERKKYQATLSKEERVHVKKSIRWLTLKRPDTLNAAEEKALAVVRETIPELGKAYDFKEAFFRIYDDPDKASAQHAFEAWENTLPDGELELFHSLAKTVHNHYEDIFAYWDSPGRITNAYTECLNGLIKLSNRLGHGYSYEIIRAKTLYAKHARKVGSGVRLSKPSETQIPTKSTTETVEYGPHIPTLVEIAESGGLD